MQGTFSNTRVSSTKDHTGVCEEILGRYHVHIYFDTCCTLCCAYFVQHRSVLSANPHFVLSLPVDKVTLSLVLGRLSPLWGLGVLVQA